MELVSKRKIAQSTKISLKITYVPFSWLPIIRFEHTFSHFLVLYSQLSFDRSYSKCFLKYFDFILYIEPQ